MSNDEFWIAPVEDIQTAKGRKVIGSVANRGRGHAKAAVDGGVGWSSRLALAEPKKEGKCPTETLHRQVKYPNNVIEADHGKLKQLIRPVRGFKTLKTVYATIRGLEVIRALRKGQASALNITNDIAGEALIVERALGLGASALAQAVQFVNAHLKLEAA